MLADWIRSRFQLIAAVLLVVSLVLTFVVLRQSDSLNQARENGRIGECIRALIVEFSADGNISLDDVFALCPGVDEVRTIPHDDTVPTAVTTTTTTFVATTAVTRPRTTTRTSVVSRPHTTQPTSTVVPVTTTTTQAPRVTTTTRPCPAQTVPPSVPMIPTCPRRP